MDSESPETLAGLESLDLKTAHDRLDEQTSEGLQSEDPQERRAAELDLEYETVAYELYSSFCGMMESMGAEVPSKDRQKSTAQLAGKVAAKHDATIIKNLGVEWMLVAAVLSDWGPQIGKKLKERAQSLEQPTETTDHAG